MSREIFVDTLFVVAKGDRSGPYFQPTFRASRFHGVDEKLIDMKRDTIILASVLGALGVIIVSYRRSQREPAPIYPPFVMSRVKDGDVLSGKKVIGVDVYDRNVLENLTFSVDGKSTEELAFWGATKPGSIAYAQVGIVTSDYKNGFYTLTLADQMGRKHTKKVKFQNKILNFSTDSVIFDTTPGVTDVPQKIRITGVVDNPKIDTHWAVVIRRDTGLAIRTYVGTGAKIDVTWNGKNEKGVESSNLNYTVESSCGSSQLNALKAAGVSADTVVDKVKS